MHITFNGKSMEIADNTSILQCLLQQDLDVAKVVVERNTVIVPSTDFATVVLQADDILEVLHFVGGG